MYTFRKVWRLTWCLGTLNNQVTRIKTNEGHHYHEHNPHWKTSLEVNVKIIKLLHIFSSAANNYCILHDDNKDNNNNNSIDNLQSLSLLIFRQPSIRPPKYCNAIPKEKTVATLWAQCYLPPSNPPTIRHHWQTKTLLTWMLLQQCQETSETMSY